MSLPKEPQGSNASQDRQHLKFNRDVLPDFKRRPENWEHDGGIEAPELGSQEETDSILKWAGIAVLLLLVAGIAGITLHQRSGGADDELAEAGAGVEPREGVEQVVRDYLGAANLEGRLAMVRRAEKVAPLMADYYKVMEAYPQKVWGFEMVEQRDFDGRDFWIVVANTPDGRQFLMVEQTGGEYKVDWETHVGYNPLPTDDYVKTRPAGRKAFRVYVTPDEYYNEPFDEFDKFLPAKLEFADSPMPIFGYLRKDSPDHSRFLKLLDGRKKVPLILELEWPEDPDGKLSKRLPQVEITRLVGERWLVLD